MYTVSRLVYDKFFEERRKKTFTTSKYKRAAMEIDSQELRKT